MGDRTERVKGAAQQAKGKLKKDAGRETGRTGTEARGAAEELKGKATSKIAEVKSAVKKATR